MPKSLSQRKTVFRQTHYMTIEVRGFVPNFNGHIVRLALHLWGLPRIIEMIRFNFIIAIVGFAARAESVKLIDCAIAPFCSSQFAQNADIGIKR